MKETGIDDFHTHKPLSEQQRAENRRMFAELDARFGIVRKNKEEKKEVNRIERVKHLEELSKWQPKTREEKASEISADAFIASTKD